MPTQSQNRPESLAFLKEANLAYFFHDRLSPLVTEIVDSFSERRANFVSAELLEAFLWMHLGLRVNYFPLELSRRLTYEHMHFFLRAHERILAARLMESWFTPPLRAIWESEFSGRQELFSFGHKWEDGSSVSQRLASVFQSLFILANGFAQDSKARELLLTMVVATDSEWDVAVRNNTPLEALERIDSVVGLQPPQHWTHPGFFEVLDYMRAFRRVDADATQTLEDSRPANIFPETQQYVYLIREAQQWRLNFGYTAYRARFLQVARLAAETFTNLPEREKGYEAQLAGEEFIKELYPLMTDWGAPQAATA